MAASEDSLSRAVARLWAEGLVAYPTETVWGLGARAESGPAVDRLRRWKGRHADQPTSLLVEGVDELPSLGFARNPLADQLIERFWPGPLTLILRHVGGLAAGIARADGAVGVRCSSHPLAAALAAAARSAGLGPITATSLNRSGEPAARSREHAAKICRGGPEAPLVLDEFEQGAVRKRGREEERADSAPSTVVDVCGTRPRILRCGAIERCAIEAVLGPVEHPDSADRVPSREQRERTDSERSEGA
ncbi:MAG: L-threonylcarbamoyladenylate synthase [Myxococcota bacterium]